MGQLLVFLVILPVQRGIITSSKFLFRISSDLLIIVLFSFSNNDGSTRQESGALNEISGSYSFITQEGENVNVSYVADETGFHATGSHIVMPPHVQRMLDHLAKVNGLARL